MKRFSSDIVGCSNMYISLLNMFDKAGVPQESRWLSLLLFFREIKDCNYISDMQKISLQKLFANILEQRCYSSERLDLVLKEYLDILVKPHKELIDSLIQEASGVVSGFQKMISTHYGNIANLEEESVSIIADLDAGSDPVTELRQAFSRVKNLLADDLRHLEDIATMDELTKITNRRGFDAFMKRAVDKWRLETIPLALAILDIDHFKRFNDEHGHRIGDQVLFVVGTHLKKILEEFGPGNDVLAARYGGEEFALAVCGPDAGKLPAVTRKCCDLVKKFNFLIRDPNGNVLESGLHITLSAGIAFASTTWRGAYMENLVDNADRALYFAKNTGRDRAVEFRMDKEAPFVLIEC